MTKRLPLVIISASILAITGCGDTPVNEPAAAMPSPAATTGPPAATQVECVNVERAYTAWSRGAIGAGTNAANLNDLTVKMAMDDGKSFLDDVTGYPDQASKALAAAVADYNYQLSIVNVGVTISGEADQDAVHDAIASTAKIQSAYDTFKSGTCA